MAGSRLFNILFSLVIVNIILIIGFYVLATLYLYNISSEDLMVYMGLIVLLSGLIGIAVFSILPTDEIKGGAFDWSALKNQAQQAASNTAGQFAYQAAYQAALNKGLDSASAATLADTARQAAIAGVNVASSATSAATNIASQQLQSKMSPGALQTLQSVKAAASPLGDIVGQTTQGVLSANTPLPMQ